MAYYTGAATRPDRAKAIAAVVAVHAALAAVIFTGLNVSTVREAVERMTTIDIKEPPRPPPETRPPPKSRPRPEKREAGAPAKNAEPSPIVAPKPHIPVQSPIPAAKIAGTGSATTSGAAAYGSGTGAGGLGTGSGGGGGGGFTPAEKITKVPDSEYRRLVAVSGMDRGSVGVSIRVTPDGRATNCRVVRSSGSLVADSLMCELTERYVRFRPALDPRGRAVAQDVIWYPNWYRR
jgi:protein TonB